MIWPVRYTLMLLLTASSLASGYGLRYWVQQKFIEPKKQQANSKSTSSK